MGCCCSSRRSVMVVRTPVYGYYPQTAELPVHLPSNRAASPLVSTGICRDGNLQRLIPETFRAHPAPEPFDAGLTFSRILPTNFQNRGNKPSCMPTSDSSLGGTASDGTLEDSDTLKDLKLSDNKADVDHATVKVIEDESKKPSETLTSTTDEEDVCPTCLEDYDFENPQIITKCKHHFHLSCILEWMERSATCPICDQIMLYDLN